MYRMIDGTLEPFLHPPRSSGERRTQGDATTMGPPRGQRDEMPAGAARAGKVQPRASGDGGDAPMRAAWPHIDYAPTPYARGCTSH
jgi:hypothetical protein